MVDTKKKEGVVRGIRSSNEKFEKIYKHSLSVGGMDGSLRIEFIEKYIIFIDYH